MIASPLPSLNALSLLWPTDWTALFSADRPLILEIGFGTGAFLRHLAETRPDANIIGLEISNRCLLKAEKMLAREGHRNVRVIHSRAETALRHLLAPASLTEVIINYPDPWFKRDHSHRRLMQRDTLDAIVSRLRPGGRLSLATDIADYAELSHLLLSETVGLDNLFDEPFTQAVPGRVVTKYEAKARREGRRSYYFAYTRNHHAVPALPVIQETAMPHVVIASRLSLDEIRAAFQPFDANEGEIYVGFSEIFRGRSSLLVEIHAAEPTIDQHTALLIAPHGEARSEYTIQMSTIGHPRATAGMHLAVRALAAWAISLAEGSRIIGQKLADDSD